jgi:hypothetical protein
MGRPGVKAVDIYAVYVKVRLVLSTYNSPSANQRIVLRRALGTGSRIFGTAIGFREVGLCRETDMVVT